jgi:hypothetical protein
MAANVNEEAGARGPGRRKRTDAVVVVWPVTGPSASTMATTQPGAQTLGGTPEGVA